MVDGILVARTGKYQVWYNGEWYGTADTYEEADNMLTRLQLSEYDDEYEEEDADEVERQMWLNDHEYDDLLDCWYEKE